MIRGLLRRWLLIELGVLGDQLNALKMQFDALGESHAALKERFERFQNRSGMRWARNPPAVDQEALREALKSLGGRPGGNSDFGEF